jgi:succinyl-CoA synthetase beta subunit
VTPIDEVIARDMIDGLKGKAILYGYRGQEPYDIDALIETLIKVSNLLTSHPELKTIDINPLILRKKGAGAIIVDVKIEVFQ